MSRSIEKNISIELLRFLSMLMILMLHYFNQGRVLELTQRGSQMYFVVWSIEAFCFISVNCYMLISGYFLSERAFSWRRLLSFYATVLFYSVAISLICYLSGIVEFSFKSFLSVFPIIGSRSNWYVTVYVAVLLISPLLNLIPNSFSKDTFKRVLIVLFVLFSVFPTLFFWSDQFNVSSGYSILWFMFLYVLGAYIKRYGLAISFVKAIFMYLSLALLPIVKFTIDLFFSNTSLGGYAGMLYAYNSIPCFMASLVLFCFIVNQNRQYSIFGSKVISFLGKVSFGVFFIHSFVLVRDKLWIAMGSMKYIGSRWSVIHGFICILIVYFACGIVDFIRDKLFNLLKINACINKIAKQLDKKYPI